MPAQDFLVAIRDGSGYNDMQEMRKHMKQEEKGVLVMGVLTTEGTQFHMDGKPFRIISGAMHYFRIVPEYWEDRLRKLKACGFNTVETYTCWNLHERREGEFDFSGMLDIVAYIRIAQKLGLYVILRPGPYICGEWDLGGLPSWLLREPGMGLRCRDAEFLRKVRRYYRELLSRIRPMLCTNGGNIIMMQVENEYGSYGNDRDYLLEIERIYRENGIDCLLFTSDGSNDWMLSGGSLPHLLTTVNFGSRPEVNFRELEKFKAGQPRMCTEFWSGWFDHWYEDHHTRSPEEIAENLLELQRSGASYNFYMFHGGTNFGFCNGANHTGTEYQPTVTSYDYCAPLSECGDMTPTYHKIRKILGAPEPEDVHNLPKAAYGEVRLTQSAPLLPQAAALAEKQSAAQTKTMEQLGQDFGYTLYATTLRGPFTALPLELGRVHDRALVYVDGKQAGIWERSRKKGNVVLSLAVGETARLEILVENLGRVNYGNKLLDCKGLLDGVRLGSQFHFGWDMYCLTMENMSGLAWQPAEAWNGLPQFLWGSLHIEGTPRDTFLRLPEFSKGFCMVNGFHIGRYWNTAGPQKTLYVPAPLLKQGDNEIIVFETDGFGEPVICFEEALDLG